MWTSIMTNLKEIQRIRLGSRKIKFVEDTIKYNIVISEPQILCSSFEVIKLTILWIIYSSQFPALCFRFHVLLSRLFSRLSWIMLVVHNRNCNKNTNRMHLKLNFNLHSFWLCLKFLWFPETSHKHLFSVLSDFSCSVLSLFSAASEQLLCVYIIPCFIPFKISCNFSALCSKLHAVFSILFLRSLSKQSSNTWNDTLLHYMATVLVQLTCVVICWVFY